MRTGASVLSHPPSPIDFSRLLKASCSDMSKSHNDFASATVSPLQGSASLIGSPRRLRSSVISLSDGPSSRSTPPCAHLACSEPDPTRHSPMSSPPARSAHTRPASHVQLPQRTLSSPSPHVKAIAPLSLSAAPRGLRVVTCLPLGWSVSHPYAATTNRLRAADPWWMLPAAVSAPRSQCLGGTYLSVRHRGYVPPDRFRVIWARKPQPTYTRPPMWTPLRARLDCSALGSSPRSSPGQRKAQAPYIPRRNINLLRWCARSRYIRDLLPIAACALPDDDLPDRKRLCTLLRRSLPGIGGVTTVARTHIHTAHLPYPLPTSPPSCLPRASATRTRTAVHQTGHRAGVRRDAWPVLCACVFAFVQRSCGARTVHRRLLSLSRSLSSRFAPLSPVVSPLPHGKSASIRCYVHDPSVSVRYMTKRRRASRSSQLMDPFRRYWGVIGPSPREFSLQKETHG
ncbi:hypothetical protein HYPSUDRAFT_200654 [Hypholoma sublateritium FD-334 SS-4]|uniref:Uncharacterized protein n=1 Tax=Hypholoma sublateritium (strain FD-334 SS-4) TaxID=945553 RepID=A0A0D2MKY1_HYPSF|nr:hypothetical protein HYPSUDRAFT_200654 [Hypholoma sublateritium FD-334 SS-4]